MLDRVTLRDRGDRVSDIEADPLEVAPADSVHSGLPRIEAWQDSAKIAAKALRRAGVVAALFVAPRLPLGEQLIRLHFETWRDLTPIAYERADGRG